MAASTKTEAQEIASLARAIGHPLRVAVLHRLCETPSMVGELVAALDVEPTVLSKHLAVLREAGLVDCEVQWRCRQYRLVDADMVRDALSALGQVVTSVASSREVFDGSDRRTKRG